jgi:hypothetical protein
MSRYRMTPPVRGRCPSPRDAERFNVRQRERRQTRAAQLSFAARAFAAADVGSAAQLSLVQLSLDSSWAVMDQLRLGNSRVIQLAK